MKRRITVEQLQAEEKSYEICEICGDKGEVRGDYWVRTLCDRCWKKKCN